MKIVADDKIPFLKGVLEPFAEVIYLPGSQIKQSILKNAEALITRSITPCNAELLENTGIQLIVSATIGDDHIDKHFCKNKGIHWMTAKGCNANAVEQYVTSALLEMSDYFSYPLAGKTLGIIGVGNIGLLVQKIAAALGMKTLLNDPPRACREGPDQFSSLEEIQGKADIITLHVPLTYRGSDKTFHLLEENFFKGLKKQPAFINTSRGAVVESNILNSATKKGWLSYLVLDVWENEPLIVTELVEMTNIATPHIAGYSLKGKANATAMIVNYISDYFKLGLKNWYPKLDISKKMVEIQCSGLTDLEIIKKVFDQVYRVKIDSDNFKRDPEHFEEFRRNYTYRSENDEFEISATNFTGRLLKTFETLGFNINHNNK